jgi:hypothetical protein
LARQQDGETGFAIPIEVGYSGQQGQHIGTQSLCLVEDQQHGELALVGQPLNFLADGA